MASLPFLTQTRPAGASSLGRKSRRRDSAIHLCLDSYSFLHKANCRGSDSLSGREGRKIHTVYNAYENLENLAWMQ
jgi:hypothetical protein